MNQTTTATEDAEDAVLAVGSGHARIGALDGLRGLAVVAVVLYHGGHLRGGFLGVDLFFVLSGYLITGILLRSWREQRGVDLGRFWSRRARRLLPALLLMLAVVVPVFALGFATGPELTVLRRDGIGSLLYVANWEQIFYGQVYGARDLTAPLRHTWSLAVEEQFYVLWPLAVLALLRARGPRAVRTAAPALAVTSAVVTIALAASGAFSLNSLYLGTHSRAAALLAGAALAAWTASTHRTRRRPEANLSLEAGAGAALLILVAMCVTMAVTDRALYTGGLVVSALCSTVLVAAAAQARPGPLVQLLEAAPLRWLGTTSYGIYLWSWPIMQMVSEKHTPLRGWALFAVQAALTLAAASVSWYLVERPILNGALRPATAKQALAIAMAAVMVVVIVATSDAQPLVSDRQSTAGYTVGGADAPRLLVVGDSVPARIAEEGIAPLASELGVSVVDRSIPGCILLREAGKVKGAEGNIRDDVTPCDRDWKGTVDQLRPDIVLVMFGQFAADQVELGGEFRKPCTPEYRDAERAALERGIGQLAGTGAHVVLATMPGTQVEWVLDRTPDLNEQMGCLNQVYQDVAAQRPDTDVVDFAGLVCPGNHCLDQLDGVNLREDTVHFRGAGARLAARWLIPRVLATRPGVGTTVPPTTTGTPVPAFCSQADRLGEAFTLHPAGEGQPAVTPDAMAAIRALPLDQFVADAPPEIAAQVKDLVDQVDPLLERLSKLPHDATEEQLIAAFGPAMPSALTLAQWYEDHC